MKIIIAICALILISCATTAPMKERIMSKEDRITFMSNRGDKYNDVMKEEFVEGKLVLDMPKELVVRLYGKPNKKFLSNTIWYYTDKWDSSLLRVAFDEFGKIREYSFDRFK